MTKVKPRKLSLGEILENKRKASSELNQKKNTYTYSIKVGDLHYEIRQKAK